MADLVLDWEALGAYGTTLAEGETGASSATVDLGAVSADIAFDAAGHAVDVALTPLGGGPTVSENTLSGEDLTTFADQDGSIPVSIAGPVARIELAHAIGDDKLIGDGGADTIDGGDGRDLILGATGGDVIDGRSGPAGIAADGASLDRDTLDLSNSVPAGGSFATSSHPPIARTASWNSTARTGGPGRSQPFNSRTWRTSCALHPERLSQRPWANAW